MEKKAKVLVVDDEQGLRDLLFFELSSQNYDVVTASDGEDAIEKIQKEKFDLVISDIKMPKKDGIQTLEEIKKIDSDIEVIMATGFGTIETAVDAMKKGAYDFVQKPFNIDEILVLTNKALEKRELKLVIALYESSKAIFSTIKLDDLLKMVINLTSRILRADDVSVMLVGDDKKLFIAASTGLDDEIKNKTRIAIGENISGRVADSKEPLIINGSIKDDPRFNGLDGRDEIKSSLIYPLISNNELVGILNVNRINNSEPFTSSDARNSTIFASQIAQAIANSKLYKALEKKIEELRETYQKLEDTQQELIQTEKLAAIGELTAGIAHELNNPLTSVLGYSQLLLQTEPLSEDVKKDIETIRSEADRCRKIIQNLLLFSRRHQSKKEPTNINEIIESTLELVGYDFKVDNIIIEKQFGSNLPNVSVDAIQMKQVFLNIITNARHATKGREKAKVIIKTEAMDKMRIHFIDNGSGISEQNIKKIFTPFFTTKEVGKGTGLGLSISYGIIKNHNGNILVNSKEGEGTTFTVELPL